MIHFPSSRRRLALASAGALIGALLPLAPLVQVQSASATAGMAPHFTDLGVAGNTMGGPLRLYDDDSIAFSEGFYSSSGTFTPAPTPSGAAGAMSIDGATESGLLIGGANFDSGANSERLSYWDPTSGATGAYSSPCSDDYPQSSGPDVTIPEYYSGAVAAGSGSEVVASTVTCYPSTKPANAFVTISSPGAGGVPLDGVDNGVDAINANWILEPPSSSDDSDSAPETRISRSGGSSVLPLQGNLTLSALAADGTVVGANNSTATEGDVIAPDGTVTKLIAPPGRVAGGVAINAKHMVVGLSAKADSTSSTGYGDYALTLWPTPTSQPVDLSSLLPAGWKNAIPFLINSRGDIVGGALAPDGKAHAFLTGINLLTVTTTADDDEVASGFTDDECRDAANLCSLRAAIELADRRSGPQVISFALTDPRIPLTAPLPPITVPVTIDGTTEPGTATGSYGIDLSGVSLPAGSNGLTLSGGNSTVTGLSMAGFDGAAISLQGAGGDTVKGNFLGQETRYSGAGQPAVGDGIGVDVASPQDTITGNHIWGIPGGSPEDRAKAIAASLGSKPSQDAAINALARIGTGISITKAAATGAAITKNDLGAGHDGDFAKNGLLFGVLIAPSDGALSGVTVDSNDVNGLVFGVAGLPLDGGSLPGLTVTANNIGTQPTAIGNTRIGALIGVVVGGEKPGSASGLSIRGNSVTNDIIGITVAGAGVSGATVGGNTLGSDKTLSDVDKTPLLDRDLLGVILSDASSVTVSDNKIAGGIIDVLIHGSAHSGDVVSGNTLGALVAPHKTPDSSVLDEHASNSSLNDYSSVLGILDSQGSADRLTGNQVSGAVFGVLASGTRNIEISANTVDSTLLGLFTADATKSTIGGPAGGNTVTDSLIGVLLGAGGLSDSTAKKDGLDAVLIGDATRSKAFMTADAPTAATLASDLTGTDISADNVQIDGGSSPDDLVEGNTIGAPRQGNDIAFVGSGLFSSMLITKNTISHNRYTGLLLGADAAKNTPTGVTIRDNSIYDNETDGHVAGATGLGIDLLGRPASSLDLLTGPNPQHAGGEQNGAPNGYVNAPELVSAAPSGSTLTVTGTMVTDKHSRVVIEAFTDNGCNVTGYGEAQTSLGVFTVTTDGNGVATYSHTFHHRVTAGDRYATATATQLVGGGVGDTSEISACVSIQSGGLPVTPTNPVVTSAGGLNLTVTCDESGPCVGTDTLSGAGATNGNGAATAHLEGAAGTTKVTLASAKVNIKAHRKATLKLKLSAKALAALKKSGSLRVTSKLVVTVKGKRITRTSVFTIFAPAVARKKPATKHLHAEM